jgi:hypothetical protein
MCDCAYLALDKDHWGFCEHGNEHFVYIEPGEFLDYLGGHKISRKSVLHGMKQITYH